MITLKLHIIKIGDSAYIENKQRNYSYAFRTLFTRIDESCDACFIERFMSRFQLNDIEFRSILADVKSFKNREMTQEKQRLQNIEDINVTLSENSTELSPHKRFKLLNKLAYNETMLGKMTCFGGRDLLRQLTKECNKTDKDTKKIESLRKEYRRKRISMPFSILGEANQKGNRFFDLTRIAKEICIYKPNKDTKIEILFTANKQQKNTLEKLQTMILNKDISVFIRLSTDFLYLCYDEEHLNGYSVDERSRRIAVKEIKNLCYPKEIESEKIKEIYKKFYDIQRSKKLEDKIPRRCIAVDLNPTNIGYSIMDKLDNEGNYKVKCTGKFDLKHYFKKHGWSSGDKRQVHLNNKRKYELTIILKKLFAIANNYRCSMFAIEELEFKEKAKEERSKEFNRKNKNLWCRSLVKQILTRKCNEYGIELVEVNPCYSSFIGNIQHPYGDSASASVEVGRRGLFKYINGMFYPSITQEDTGTLESIYGNDALCSTERDWKSIYKSLKEHFGNKEFQYRARTMNVRCTTRSFRSSSRKSRTYSTKFYSFP